MLQSMRKILQNITERPGLCLFLLLLGLSLFLTEFSLHKAVKFPEGERILVSGRIVEVALPQKSSDDYRRIKIRLDHHTVISTSLKLSGLTQGASSEEIKRGATISVSGIHTGGNVAQNPGGFSERNWFRTQGVSGKLTQPQLTAVEAAPLYYRPLNYLDDFRLRVLKLLEESFSAEGAEGAPRESADFQLSSVGILPALLMGHTAGMTAYTGKALSEAGAYHLLCVSGMHLMFFLLPIRRVSAWAALSFNTKRKLLSVLVLFPGLLSGFGHGISRATLLFYLSSLDSRVQRRADRINSLALAACVLLLIQPFAVRQNGFWMSFIAAGCLKLLSPDTGKRLLDDLISTLAVFLILLPLTVKLQQGANLLAPFANLILIPLASYLTVVGFLILFLSFIFPFFSLQIQFLASFLTEPVLRLWLELVSVVANCRSTFFCKRDLIHLAVFLFLLLAIFYLLRLRSYKLLFPALLLLCTFLLVPFIEKTQKDEYIDILFLDVGQGDATLLLTKEKTILIDGGDAGMGYQRILPALRSQGRDHVDLAVLTHGHADHVLGALELMSLGRIDCLVLPQPPQAKEAQVVETQGDLDVPDLGSNPFEQNEVDWMDYLLFCAAKKGLSVNYVISDDSLSMDGLNFSFIAPNLEDLGRGDDLNDSSLAFYLDYYRHSFLFTGDMTRETEERLVRSQQLRSVDYLHVAHHGSGMTTNDSFLEQIKARWAIIPVGANNLYNHPHPDTLERLQEHAVRTVSLDEKHAFFLRLSEADSRIVLWQ